MTTVLTTVLNNYRNVQLTICMNRMRFKKPKLSSMSWLCSFWHCCWCCLLLDSSEYTWEVRRVSCCWRWGWLYCFANYSAALSDSVCGTSFLVWCSLLLMKRRIRDKGSLWTDQTMFQRSLWDEPLTGFQVIVSCGRRRRRRIRQCTMSSSFHQKGTLWTDQTFFQKGL